MGCTPSLGSSLWPSSGCSPTGLYLACIEDSTSGCNTPDKVSPAQSGGAEGQDHCPDLLAMLLLMQPKIRLDFWAARVHCCLMSILTTTSTPKSFPTRLRLLHPQACICCHNPKRQYYSKYCNHIHFYQEDISSCIMLVSVLI